MRRRARRWLIGLGVIVALVALLGGYVLRALRPPVGPPAEPIRTALGLIQGTREDGLTVYRGIPYAAPPVGELRWRPPAPASWQGTLDASHFKAPCMQVGGVLPGSSPPSEDCLGLNIWTPATRANERLAVIVFLHGGGFSNGSSDLRFFWGDALARKGVVVVTLNYRLGVLGFLAHPDLTAESPEHTSGNYALLDCLAALRWVKSNIAAFGGDPANVTLFGQSAGAFLASDLMASPLAAGLFARVIGMSGADIGDAGTQAGIPFREQAEASGLEFAESMGATSLADLRALPASALVEKAGTFAETPLLNLPNVDGYVLPQQADTLLPTVQHIDLLAGIDAEDGVSVGEHPDAHQSQLAAAMAAWRAFTWVSLNTKSGQAQTYAYVFSRAPPWSDKASHGTDLFYLLGFPPRGVFYVVPWRARRDSEIAEQMQSYWTNFAKTGDPNGAGLPSWQPFAASGSVLNFADSTHMDAWPYRSGITRLEAGREAQRAPARPSVGNDAATR